MLPAKQLFEVPAVGEHRDQGEALKYNGWKAFGQECDGSDQIGYEE